MSHDLIIQPKLKGEHEVHTCSVSCNTLFIGMLLIILLMLLGIDVGLALP